MQVAGTTTEGKHYKTERSSHRLVCSNLELVQTENCLVPDPYHRSIHHLAAGSPWLWARCPEVYFLDWTSSGITVVQEATRGHVVTSFMLLLPQATVKPEIRVDLMASDAARGCVHAHADAHGPGCQLGPC